MDELRKLYYSPGAPTSAQALQKLLKKEGVNLPLNDITKFLKNESTHQIHAKKKRLNLNVARTFAPFDIWESDWLSLGDDAHSRTNKGNAHILVCVDKFSKMIFAKPVKKVDDRSITQAMRNILHESLDKYGMRPNRILTDAGGAYKSAGWNKLMNEYNIKHNIVYMAYEAERMIKTVKSAIGRVLTQRGDKKWVEVLEDLIAMINKREHRGLWMSPNEAVDHPHTALKNLEKYWKTVKDKEPKVLQVKDNVRIRVEQGAFKKGHRQTFSNEVYTISHVFAPTNDYQSYRYALEGIRDRVFNYNDIIETDDPASPVAQKKKPLDRLQKQARKELQDLQDLQPDKLPFKLRSERHKPVKPKGSFLHVEIPKRTKSF